MKRMKKLGPLKNVDSVQRTQFLRIFISFFSAFGLVGFFTFRMKGLFFGGLLGLVLTPPVNYIVNKLGGSAGILYGSREPNWSLKERIAGDLDRVKYFKMRKEYDRALSVADEVLATAPESPEALLLKSQILIDGFGNYGDAERCLKKIFKTCSDQNEPVRRWAYNYYQDVVKNGVNK